MTRLFNERLYEPTVYARHTLYKHDDIYDCLACGKKYTTLMIDKHLLECPKMDEHIARLGESEYD